MSVSDWLQIVLGFYFFIARGVVFVLSRIPRCGSVKVSHTLTPETAEGAD